MSLIPEAGYVGLSQVSRGIEMFILGDQRLLERIEK